MRKKLCLIQNLSFQLVWSTFDPTMQKGVKCEKNIILSFLPCIILKASRVCESRLLAIPFVSALLLPSDKPTINALKLLCFSQAKVSLSHLRQALSMDAILFLARHKTGTNFSHHSASFKALQTQPMSRKSCLLPAQAQKPCQWKIVRENLLIIHTSNRKLISIMSRKNFYFLTFSGFYAWFFLTLAKLIKFLERTYLFYRVLLKTGPRPMARLPATHSWFSTVFLSSGNSTHIFGCATWTTMSKNSFTILIIIWTFFIVSFVACC